MNQQLEYQTCVDMEVLTVCFEMAKILESLKNQQNMLETNLRRFAALPGAKLSGKKNHLSMDNYWAPCYNILEDWLPNNVAKEFANFIQGPELPNVVDFLTNQRGTLLKESFSLANSFLPEDLSRKEVYCIRVEVSSDPAEATTTGRMIKFNAYHLLGLEFKVIMSIMAHEFIHMGTHFRTGAEDNQQSDYFFSDLLDEGWATNPQLSENLELPGNHSSDWQESLNALSHHMKRLDFELASKKTGDTDPIIDRKWFEPDPAPLPKGQAAFVAGGKTDKIWKLGPGYAVGWALMASAYSCYDQNIKKLFQIAKKSPLEIWEKCSSGLLNGCTPPRPTGRLRGKDFGSYPSGATVRTQPHFERNRKSHGILHGLLDRFINTRDSRAFVWARKPDSVMKEEDDPDRQPGVFEIPMKPQQRDFEDIDLQHLDYRLPCLSFLPVRKRGFTVETAPPPIKRSHEAFGR